MKSGFSGLGLYAVVFLTAALPRIVEAQDFLIPPALYAVQGAPFTATIDSSWEGTETVLPGTSVTRILRDSAGRERYEFPATGGSAFTDKPTQVIIYDVVAEKVIRLDTQLKKARVTPMQYTGRPIIIDLSKPVTPGHVGPGGTYLGTRAIAGLEVWGQHLVQTHPGRDGQPPVEEVRELWLSTAYRMPLMEVRKDRRVGMITQQVIQLEAAEPDPALFVVPQGYVVGR
jgi:hypothetical protein